MHCPICRTAGEYSCTLFGSKCEYRWTATACPRCHSHSVCVHRAGRFVCGQRWRVVQVELQDLKQLQAGPALLVPECGGSGTRRQNGRLCHARSTRVTSKVEEKAGYKVSILVEQSAVFSSSSSPATPPSPSLSSQTAQKAAAETLKSTQAHCAPRPPRSGAPSHRTSGGIVYVHLDQSVPARGSLCFSSSPLHARSLLARNQSTRSIPDKRRTSPPPSSSPVLLLRNGTSVAQKPPLLFVRISPPRRSIPCVRPCRHVCLFFTPFHIHTSLAFCFGRNNFALPYYHALFAYSSSCIGANPTSSPCS